MVKLIGGGERELIRVTNSHYFGPFRMVLLHRLLASSLLPQPLPTSGHFDLGDLGPSSWDNPDHAT